MKAILVIDEPKDCFTCELGGSKVCIGGCPLKPLPSFKAVDLNDIRDVVMFCHGWNTCLAEITGETE